MKSIRTKITLAVILCALVSTAICGGISIVNTSRTSYENSKKEMSLVCENKSEELNSMLDRVSQSVDTLYSISLSNLDDIEQFKTNQEYVDAYTEKMSSILLEFANHTQGALTAYLRYNPQYTQPTSGLFYTRDSKDSEFESVTPTDFSMYDASDTEHVGWYYIPVENKKPTWMEPYLNSNIDVYMVSYVIPIYINGESVGIIGMDIDFSEFTQVLEESSIFDTGYAYLANEQGVVMAHKDLSVGTSLAEADSGLAEVAKAIGEGGEAQGFVYYNYQDTDRVMYHSNLKNGMRYMLAAPVSELQAQAMHMVWLISQGAAIAIVISILIGLFISGRLTKPIKQINKVVAKTAEFNFSHDPRNEKLYKKKDETGNMANSLHNMRLSLRTMVADIRLVYSSIVQTMEKLSGTTNLVNTMSEENSATTQELAAAMEETAATMETVNHTVGTVREQAESIKERSKEGKMSSNEVKNRADTLKGTTKDASDKTRTMYEGVRVKTEQAVEQAKAVEKINELTSVILNISSQTNLLALNASIEAARAGEAGRGFAIVASEIGNLASQTSDTVVDINIIIKEVNGAVTNMSSCLQDTTDFLEKTVLEDYSGFTDVAGRYSEDAVSFDEDMTKINTAVEILLGEIVEIADSIENVSNTIGEAAAGVSDIAQKTQQMTETVQTNTSLVESSRVNTDKLKTITEMFSIQDSSK